jgi:uncharacterized protein YbaR (Trm112 family)
VPLIDPHLAELLICPLCHGELATEEDAAQLRCRACDRTYPVRDFPIMMPEVQDSEVQDVELTEELDSLPEV